MTFEEHVLALRLSSSDKEAEAYEFSGDVQGVHLRATLHKLLNRYRARGLAYNDARTGKTYALVEGSEAKRKRVLGALHQYLQSNPKVTHYALQPVPETPKLLPVDLGDDDLEAMFTRQGLTGHGLDMSDPVAARRRYAKKRFRLVQNRQTGRLSGRVPELAYKQLAGQEPIYRDQIAHPDWYGPQHWDGAPKPPKTASARRGRLLVRVIRGEPSTKEAMNNWYANGNADWYCEECKHPFSGDEHTCDICGADCSRTNKPLARQLGVLKEKEAAAKDRPFTIAVDLDGTLAETLDPHDPDRIGDPIEENVEWVRLWKAHGCRIIIWTVRGDEEMVAKWLEENDVPYDYINENPDQPEGASCKVIADFYWDDRGRDATDPESAEEILEAIHAQSDDSENHRPVVLEKTMTIRVLFAPEEVMEEIGDDDSEDEDEDEAPGCSDPVDD